MISIVFGFWLTIERWQGDDKLCSLTQFAIHMDGTIGGVDDTLDIGQSQSEAFHIVAIARVYAIEAVEDFPYIFALDTNTVVGDGDLYAALFGVACLNSQD